MSGCRIGKVTMKNGGAVVHVLPQNDPQQTWGIETDCGDLTITCYGEPVTFERAFMLLESARAELWKQMEEDE